MMFQRQRIGTLTLAVAFLGIGGFLLAANLTSSSAWASILTWWPVVLILLGVEVVVRHSLPVAAATGPRWDPASMVLLTFLIVSLGIGNAARATTGFPQLVAGALGLDVEITHHTAVDLPLATGDAIVIRNPAGSVQVLGGAGNGFRAEAAIRARDLNQQLALDRASQVVLSVADENPRTLAVAVPPAPRGQGARVDLVVTVPAEVSVEVRDTPGNIEVQGITGNIRLHKGDGNGGEIRITDSGGEIKVHNRIGRLFGSDLRGNVTAEGKYLDVELIRLTGNVQVTANAVKLAEIDGNVTVRADEGGVSVRQVQGAVSVIAGSPIRFSAERMAGDMKIINESGDVDLTLPEGHYRLELEAVNGQLNVPELAAQIERLTQRELLQAVVGDQRGLPAVEGASKEEDTREGEHTPKGELPLVRVYTTRGTISAVIR